MRKNDEEKRNEELKATKTRKHGCQGSVQEDKDTEDRTRMQEKDKRGNKNTEDEIGM